MAVGKIFLFLRRRVAESVESGHFSGEIVSFASCDGCAGCDLEIFKMRWLHPSECGGRTARARRFSGRMRPRARRPAPLSNDMVSSKWRSKIAVIHKHALEVRGRVMTTMNKKSVARRASVESGSSRVLLPKGSGRSAAW